MPTFGTSAYLKVICLSDRRQRTELKKRLQPSNGGYDFHGSLKRAAERLLVEGMPEAEVLSTLDNVTKAPERASAKAGIEMLAEWRRHHPGDIVDFATVTAEGPAGIAKVSFQPTFGLQIRNQVVAVHVWNTKFPPLDRRFVLGALSLFPAAYARTGKSPDDLAVLSLRDGSLTPVPSERDQPNFFRERQRLSTTLLSTMANVLNLKIQQLDILDRVYYPDGLLQVEQQQDAVRRFFADMAIGRRALPIIIAQPTHDDAQEQRGTR